MKRSRRSPDIRKYRDRRRSKVKGQRSKEEGRELIGLGAARELVSSHTGPLESEEVPLLRAPGRVLACEVRARADSPSADVSLKDGYAVRAEDTVRASSESPAHLRVSGSRFAGEKGESAIRPGRCVKITSGAILPENADAVVGIEFCEEIAEGIRISQPVDAGLNVLARATDIEAGSALGGAGDRLGPGVAGWMAAAGLEEVPVYRLPSVALVATGDEVVAPGAPLEKGQLYASNLVTLSAWLGTFGIATGLTILPDRRDDLRRELPGAIEGHDALLTSGGAWGSERDLVVGVLEELGWKRVFHRVRMGPGKAVGFGLLEGRPVFCLPGGPPSNEMAFLQLALPGVLRLAGWKGSPFPVLRATLTEPVQGRDLDWTQFKRGRLGREADGDFRVTPYLPGSRLESIALSDCLIEVPEGVEGFEAGDRVSVQMLSLPAAWIA
jgi:molybdopterin molybdotransferase